MWTFFNSTLKLVAVLQIVTVVYAHALTLEYPLPPRWDHTPAQILTQGEHLNHRIVQFNDHIASLIDDVSVHTVLIPAINFDNERESVARHLLFFASVSTDAEVREASRAFEILYSNTVAKEGLRQDVYKVFVKLQSQLRSETREFNEKKGQVVLSHSKYQGISEEQSRFLDDTIQDFERLGLGLPKEKRDHVLELLQGEAVLCLEFAENLAEDKNYLLFTEEDLEGVPNLEQYQIIKEDGISYYKVTFQYPEITPVLAYAEKKSTRKKAYIGNKNRASANHEVLTLLVKLRYTLAKELGYDNYEQYSLLDTLAGNETVVADFLQEFKDKIVPLGKKELTQLKKLNKGEKVYAWDYNFLDRLFLEQHQVDEAHISEYFPADETAAKLLGIYETLFELKFVEVTENRQVWHEDVKQYSVWKSNGDFVGTFYFDLYPREGKFTHGANFNVYPGYQKYFKLIEKHGPVDPNRAYPVTALIVNFTKKTKDKPALFKHREVLTFFHEVGHGIHGLLSKTETARYDGTNVARDFVEAPSQALEFWTWDKRILKNLTTHYLTGEHLDDESIEKLADSKRINGALSDLRQLHYGLFDQYLHRISTDAEIADLDIKGVWNDLFEEITLFNTDGIQVSGYNSFGHIAGGYEGRYYSYLYSEVFAADIFYTLFQKDPLSVANGRRYRDVLLAKGGAQDILASLTELLGRKPNTAAFWKERGL